MILLDACEKLREEQAGREKYTAEEQTPAVNQNEATLTGELNNEITPGSCPKEAEYTKKTN